MYGILLGISRELSNIKQIMAEEGKLDMFDLEIFEAVLCLADGDGDFVDIPEEEEDYKALVETADIDTAQVKISHKYQAV